MFNYKSNSCRVLNHNIQRLYNSIPVSKGYCLRAWRSPRRTPSKSKSRNILRTSKNGKKIQKIWTGWEHINVLANRTDILCQLKKWGKWKQSTKRVNKWETVAEVTAKEEGKYKMRRSAMSEHCFENKETHETTKSRKTPRWLLCTFKEKRRNYMIGKIYLKELLLMELFSYPDESGVSI